LTVSRASFQVSSPGETEVIDITERVVAIVAESGVREGIGLVAVAGSTAAVTTVEFEPGLKEDLRAAFERLAPRRGRYGHDARWGDGNGYAHVRSSLVGTSLAFPVTAGRPALGTWQQVVLVDFDNKPRRREVTVTVVGE